jgi:hypothetical protein
MFGSNINGEVYYYRETEDVNEIVSEYNAIDGAKILVIGERESYGPYILVNQSTYFRNEVSGNLELESYTIRSIVNADGLTIASELTDPSIPFGQEGHKSISKTYYLGNYQTHPNRNIPELLIVFTPNGLFEYGIYNPKLHTDESGTDDDQDVEHLNMTEVTNMLNNLPQNMRDWYISNVFLPPI